MPDSPAEAKFLSKHEKLIAIERLRMNQTGVMSRKWRWDHLWETIRDLKTWLWFALIFSISCVPSAPNLRLVLILPQGSFWWCCLLRSPARPVIRL
ncbi:hypothetical protein NW767_006304 [Fusarium falciforme]|nr:hypothetical protein NW767_006304 [Fusarium falciforme]